MKHLLRFFTLIFFAGLMLTACEGPMGPAGADGLNGNNGADGKDGKDGKDANSTCILCHNTANQVAKEAQYELSKHFMGTTSSRNGKYCARCHTSNGFIEITGNGKFIVANDIPSATRISCETCHKHRSFEFAGDTASMVLRTISPVYLNYYNNATAQDFGATNNLCNTCHQIRGVSSAATTLPFFPLDNTKEATTLEYRQGQSFAVHDGNQSNLFAGINGYEYAGKTYTRTWKHSANKCVDCHMNQYNATTKTGGHTMIPNKAKCTECHGSDKLTTVQTAISAKLVELGEAMVAKKLARKSGSSYSILQSHDYLGALYIPNDAVTTYTSISSDNTVSPTTGLVVYGTKLTVGTDQYTANRIGREWKYGELGAAYNYGYINSELSKGVHNPIYAMQILQNSIDYLNSY